MAHPGSCPLTLLPTSLFSCISQRAYVTDVRAGNAKVFCLDVIGSPYDDGASPAEVAARLAAAKKAAEEEKLKEWQAQRAAGKKGD